MIVKEEALYLQRYFYCHFSERRKALCLKRYPLSAFRKRYSAVEMFLSTSVHQDEKRLLA